MKKIFEALIKKSFWLPPYIVTRIEKQAKKNKISESALMRSIIINWFEK